MVIGIRIREFHQHHKEKLLSDYNFYFYEDDVLKKLCTEKMRRMKDLNPPLHPLLPTRADNSRPYTLRHKSDQLYFYKSVTTCKTKRTEDFFKYF